MKMFSCYLQSYLLSFSMIAGGSGPYRQSVNSFIFSLKNKDNVPPIKMKIKQIETAIYDSNSYGVIFGDGPHDILIANDAGSNTQSVANLGKSYMLPTGYRYGTSTTNSFLAGSLRFKPDDTEVLYMQSD